MDSHIGYTRNSEFSLIIKSPKDKETDFRVLLPTTIYLNPKLKWEVAVVSAYIPTASGGKGVPTKISKPVDRKSNYQFSYINSLTNLNMTIYETHYYDQTKNGSIFNAFATAINAKMQTFKDYGAFSQQRTTNPVVKFSVDNNSKAKIEIIKNFQPGQQFIVKIPKSEWLSMFHDNTQKIEFDALQSGSALTLKSFARPFCYYDYGREQLKILQYTASPYNELSDGKLTNNISFISKSNVKQAVIDKPPTHVSKPTADITTVDIVCDIINPTKLGKLYGGESVIDVVGVDGLNENIYLKYFPLNKTEFNTFSLKIVDSNTKNKVTIVDDLYITINIRPVTEYYY